MKAVDLVARILLGLILAALPFLHYSCGGAAHDQAHMHQGGSHAYSTN
jgi:hypothetical protein